jgi:hypothetical protein
MTLVRVSNTAERRSGKTPSRSMRRQINIVNISNFIQFIQNIAHKALFVLLGSLGVVFVATFLQLSQQVIGLPIEDHSVPTT